MLIVAKTFKSPWKKTHTQRHLSPPFALTVTVVAGLPTPERRKPHHKGTAEKHEASANTDMNADFPEHSLPDFTACRGLGFSGKPVLLVQGGSRDPARPHSLCQRMLACGGTVL